MSDLNCLNAVLAVGNWKKHLSYYASAEEADETVYKVFTGTIRNGGPETATTSGHPDAAAVAPADKVESEVAA